MKVWLYLFLFFTALCFSACNQKNTPMSLTQNSGTHSHEIIKESKAVTDSVYHHTAQELYRKTGRLDTVVYYYQALLKFGNIYAQQAAHYGLAEIAIKQNDQHAAMIHLSLYKKCTEFILQEQKHNAVQHIIQIAAIASGVVLIALLFGIIQYSRRKRLLLLFKLNSLKKLQEEQHRRSELFIADNLYQIELLQQQLHDTDEANTVLRQKLEEEQNKLHYLNKVAQIEMSQREQERDALIHSEVYCQIQEILNSNTNQNISVELWKQLEEEILTLYPDFNNQLSGISHHDYHVCLLIKAGITPTNISHLTNHSKEAITSTRRRLFEKTFGRKGTPADWDNFILSI